MNQKNSSGFKAPLGAILLGVTGVLTIALIASIVFSGTQMRSIEMTDEEVYYDMLYTISTDLINADRDLYLWYRAYHSRPLHRSVLCISSVCR